MLVMKRSQRNDKSRLPTAVLILLTAVAFAPPDEGWWDARWNSRRAIAIVNISERPLPGNHPIRIFIDTVELKMTGKVNEDGSDVRLVRDGKPVPFLLEPHPSVKGNFYLWFTPSQPLKAKESANVFLYYGNAKASATEQKGSSVFPVCDDFRGASLNAVTWEAGEGMTTTGTPDGLQVKELKLPEGRTGMLKLKSLPAMESFCLETTLSYDRKANAGATSFYISLQLGETGAAIGDDVKASIEQLIADLGHDEWEKRTGAERTLSGMGKGVIPFLEAILASSDAEVRRRAQRVIDAIRTQYPEPIAQLGLSIDQDGDARLHASLMGTMLWKNFPLNTEGCVKFRLIREKGGAIEMQADGNKVFSGKLEGKPMGVVLEFGQHPQYAFRPVTLTSFRVLPVVKVPPRVSLGDEQVRP